ncbi:MAG: translation initiation factor IF-2, partial [Thermoprotei archaeon]
VIEASLTKKEDRFLAAIIAFNVKVTEEARELAREYGVPVFEGNIIYRVVEDFAKWYHEMHEREKRQTLEKLILPGAIRILPGYVFRRSNPVIVGVEVLEGRIRRGVPLMREDGRKIGEIMQIQEHGKPLNEAEKGMAVAISIRGKVMVGRQIDEGDVLYVDVPLDHIDILLSKFKEDLSEGEVELLKKIRRIKIKMRS